MMKKILYIHDYALTGREETFECLQQELGNEYELTLFEHSDNPHKALRIYFDEIEYDLVIGFSYGAFIADWRYPSCTRLLINPSLVPSVDIAKIEPSFPSKEHAVVEEKHYYANIKRYIAEIYSYYLFSANDEYFNYRNDIYYGEAPKYLIPDTHFLSKNSMINYIVPYIKHIFDEDEYREDIFRDVQTSVRVDDAVSHSYKYWQNYIPLPLACLDSFTFTTEDIGLAYFTRPWWESESTDWIFSEINIFISKKSADVINKLKAIPEDYFIQCITNNKELLTLTKIDFFEESDFTYNKLVWFRYKDPANYLNKNRMIHVYVRQIAEMFDFSLLSSIIPENDHELINGRWVYVGSGYYSPFDCTERDYDTDDFLIAGDINIYATINECDFYDKFIALQGYTYLICVTNKHLTGVFPVKDTKNISFYSGDYVLNFLIWW